MGFVKEKNIKTFKSKSIKFNNTQNPFLFNDYITSRKYLINIMVKRIKNKTLKETKNENIKKIENPGKDIRLNIHKDKSPDKINTQELKLKIISPNR